MDKLDIVISNQQFIIKQISDIMATIQELSDKVDLLQVALDEEQAQVLAAIAKLEGVVADLTAQLEGAAKPEEIQAVADKIDAVIADLKGTIADEPTA